MGHESSDDREGAERAVSVLDESAHVHFEHAPVMMHSIDKGGALVKVNRRWTETLGYEANEAVGKKGYDFLTEESRARAVNHTLPLFWRTGRARSIGYRFQRKNGGTVDLLLDAEATPGRGGSDVSFAAIYSPDDLSRWHQATRTLRTLGGLAKAQRRYENTLIESRGDAPEPRRTSGATAVVRFDGAAAGSVIAAFLELAQDTSLSMRAIARVQEEEAGAMAEHQSETLPVLRSIDKSLAYLADAVAAAPWMSN